MVHLIIMWCRMQRLLSNHFMAKVRPIMEKAEMLASNSENKELQQHPQSTLLMQEQPFIRLALLNFRKLCGSLPHGPTKAPALYRGARPECLSKPDVCTLKYQLGVRTIVDMRSEKEYRSRLSSLDSEYQLYTVQLPFLRNYRRGESVTVKKIPTQHSDTTSSDHKHILINFFCTYYILQIIRRAPWYISLCTLIYLLSKFLWPTGYIYFVRLLAVHVINDAGLLGQYKDMIDFSQRSICAALKLLTQEGDMPVLINCAHGKDRTGIISALVLYCQGHSIEDIAKEYALSEDGLKSHKEMVFDEIVMGLHLSEDFVTAKPETMKNLFCYIVEQYGSVEKYLDHIGFGPQEQEMLRRNFAQEWTGMQQ